MTADVVKLPPADPIFALAPELRLHLSEIDGALLTNSREVARVFLRDDHQQLIRHIMRRIWNDPMQPNYHDEFQQCPDGTVDITSKGLLSALSHWGFEYEETTRHREFSDAWADMVCARAREIAAEIGVNPLHQKMEELFGPAHYFTDDGRERCHVCRHLLPAGPVLHDELWATIADRHMLLCFDCIERRLGRSLTQADLTVCAFNAGWLSFDGADVVAMQFARGRRLLPTGEAAP
jgi:hypothetical protein